MIDGSEGANMDESLKDREYYQNIIDNKTRISRIRFAKTRNFDVLEIVSPIIENDETVLLISTLYTLEPFLTLRNQIRIIVVVLSFIIMSSSFLLINYYVIVPLRALELSISSFDPLSSEYTKPKKEYIIYKDTFLALDKLSKHIDRSNKERDKLHNEIYLQSITDFLTKLPNRRNLISHINKKLNNNEEFSLIFVDIDNFKNVNDSKGHVVGDEVLKESAKRLLFSCKKTHFVSRYGGDEFIIILDTISKEDIKRFTNNVYENFKIPIRVNDENSIINISLGISLFPNDGNDSTELIRKAYLAIYEAKSKGKNQFAYYNPLMDLELKEEIKIKELLEESIRNDGFKILLQPQVNIHTNEVLSFEALARLKNSNIGPYKFIPIAQKYDLIDEIGRIIVGNAIKTLLLMRNQGVELKTIYVNFSASQLRKIEIPDHMNDKMKEYGLDNKYIGVEITESVLIEKDEYAKDFFNKLKKYGFKLAIDDFGSGNASINYLTNYSLELVKLDRLFGERYLTKDKIDVYESVINLAKKLGYDVLAEGLETKEQVELLKTTNCKICQGYYYYKPLEVDEAIDLIKKK